MEIKRKKENPQLIIAGDSFFLWKVDFQLDSRKINMNLQLPFHKGCDKFKSDRC